MNLRRKVATPLQATVVKEIVADYLTWHIVVTMALRFSKRSISKSGTTFHSEMR